MRRGRWTIRGMMVGVVWCALLFATMRTPGMEWLSTLMLVTAGPIVGAFVERRRGGKGAWGGVIGGVGSYCGFGGADVRDRVPSSSVGHR